MPGGRIGILPSGGAPGGAGAPGRAAPGGGGPPACCWLSLLVGGGPAPKPGIPPICGGGRGAIGITGGIGGGTAGAAVV